MGSFSFYAKTKEDGQVGPTTELSLDPEYFGWENEDKTNKYWMHNTIEIDDGNKAL